MSPNDPNRKDERPDPRDAAIDDVGRDAAEEAAFDDRLDARGAGASSNGASLAADAPDFAALTDATRRALDGLLFAAPEATPSPDVRRRLMARVSAEGAAASVVRDRPWREWASDAPKGDALGVVFGADGGFEATAYPGVFVRKLFVDRAADRATMLIRMAPGSNYPAHRHGGLEECFVVEGTLLVGDDVVMRKGDYQAKAEGSVHPIQSTESGCLLLVSSSLRDDFV
jgi:quercetin dioxygenase-like cupin family protein